MIQVKIWWALNLTEWWTAWNKHTHLGCNKQTGHPDFNKAISMCLSSVADESSQLVSLTRFVSPGLVSRVQLVDLIHEFESWPWTRTRLVWHTMPVTPILNAVWSMRVQDSTKNFHVCLCYHYLLLYHYCPFIICWLWQKDPFSVTRMLRRSSMSIIWKVAIFWEPIKKKMLNRENTTA